MTEYHIVDTQKDGLDSFWLIAQHYGVSFQELKQLNKGKGDCNGNYTYEKRNPPYGLNNEDVVCLPSQQPSDKKIGDCVCIDIEHHISAFFLPYLSHQSN